MGEEKKTEKITNSDGHVLTEAEIRRQAAFDEKEKKIGIIYKYRHSGITRFVDSLSCRALFRKIQDADRCVLLLKYL